MSIDDIVTIINSLLHSSIFIKYGLIGLFVNGVLASTAIPLPTELTTLALLSAGYGKLGVFLVLTAGTTAGGFIGYFLGRSGNKLFNFLKGKNKKQDEDHGHKLLTKYGWIAIFGSAWIPFVGDLIPIIAGTKKYDITKFGIALALGKASKALAVVFFSAYLAGVFGF